MYFEKVWKKLLKELKVLKRVKYDFLKIYIDIRNGNDRSREEEDKCI